MSDIIEVIRRGDCFKLLAACFYEPDRSLLLEEKIGENLEYLLEEIHADGGGFARAMQIRFYYHAMKPWIGQFCDAIRKGTDNEFYVNLAECLDCFLLSCEITYSRD